MCPCPSAPTDEEKTYSYEFTEGTDNQHEHFIFVVHLFMKHSDSKFIFFTWQKTNFLHDIVWIRMNMFVVRKLFKAKSVTFFNKCFVRSGTKIRMNGNIC